MAAGRGGNNIDVYVSSYTSYFMFCVYCPARTVLIYFPNMVKKMGMHNICFHFLLCRQTPSLHPFSSASSDFCLARLKYIVRTLYSPWCTLTFSTFFPFIYFYLFHLLLLSFFPFTSPTSLLLSSSHPSKNPGRNKINASHFGGAFGPASVFKKFFQKNGGAGGPYPPVLKQAVKRGFSHCVKAKKSLFTWWEGKKVFTQAKTLCYT